MRQFGSPYYPPGVTGTEPEIAGYPYYCGDCGLDFLYEEELEDHDCDYEEPEVETEP